jgi:hypothetical protein
MPPPPKRDMVMRMEEGKEFAVEVEKLGSALDTKTSLIARVPPSSPV